MNIVHSQTPTIGQEFWLSFVAKSFALIIAFLLMGTQIAEATAQRNVSRTWHVNQEIGSHWLSGTWVTVHPNGRVDYRVLYSNGRHPSPLASNRMHAEVVTTLYNARGAVVARLSSRASVAASNFRRSREQQHTDTIRLSRAAAASVVRVENVMTNLIAVHVTRENAPYTEPGDYHFGTRNELTLLPVEQVRAPSSGRRAGIHGGSGVDWFRIGRRPYQLEP